MKHRGCFVEIGNNMPFRINSSELKRRELGLLVSRTSIEAVDGTVSVFDSGRVIIKTAHGRFQYDMATGELMTGS